MLAKALRKMKHTQVACPIMHAWQFLYTVLRFVVFPDKKIVN